MNPFVESINAEVERRTTVESVVRLLFNDSLLEHKKLIDEALKSGRTALLVGLHQASLIGSDYTTLASRKVSLQRRLHILALQKYEKKWRLSGENTIHMTYDKLSDELDCGLLELAQLEQEIKGCLPQL